MILLDGLDELSEEHGADLSWISTPLPPNVHLVLSATADSPCTQTLQVSRAQLKSIKLLISQRHQKGNAVTVTDFKLLYVIVV